MRPAARPSAVNGTTSAPCSASEPSARDGRTRRRCSSRRRRRSASPWGSAAWRVRRRALPPVRVRSGAPLASDAQIDVVGLAVGGDVDAIGAVDGVEPASRDARDRARRASSQAPAKLGRLRRARPSPASACRRSRRRAATRRTCVIATASRRGVAYGVTVAPASRKPRARKPLASAVRERCAERLQRLRRQLLGEQLDDERWRRRSCRLHSMRSGSIGKPSASRDSTYACATSRDSVRMRPM